MGLPAAKKYSQVVTTVSAPTGAEYWAAVQGGATKKITLTIIKDFCATFFATAAQGAKADSAVQYTGVTTLQNYVDDTAAAGGGVPVGGLYRNGSVVMVRVV